MRFLYRLWVFALVFSSLSFSAKAQSGCVLFYIPKVEAQPGDTVCVPVRVRDFESVASIQFAVYFDTTALERLNVDWSNSGLPFMNNTSFGQFPHKVLLSWYTLTGMPFDLPDDTQLFSICFKVKDAAPPGFYSVAIDPGANFNYEVMQMLLPDWEGNEVGVLHQPGGVSVGNAADTALQMTSACTGYNNCEIQYGYASIEIEGGAPPYSYAWTGPNGFTSNAANLTLVPPGVYTVTVNDQNGASSTAVLEVVIIYSQFPTAVTVTKSTCGEANGCAKISSYYTGYSFSWSNGQGQGNINCTLPPGDYQVTVTRIESGCTKVLDFTIGLDNNLEAGLPYTLNVSDCSTGVTLDPSPNAPFDYNFNWSTGDTTSTITVSIEDTYRVTVSYGNCTKIAQCFINNLVTSQWLIIPEGYCDPNQANSGGILFTRASSAPIQFPSVITLDNGFSKTVNAPISSFKLDSIGSMPNGIYEFTVSDANGCIFKAQNHFYCPEPVELVSPGPSFYVQDTYLDTLFKVDTCTGIYADHFIGVAALDFALFCGSNSKVKELKFYDLPGLSIDNFALDTPFNVITLHWAAENALPVTLPDSALLFEVCSQPINTIPYDYVQFHGSSLASARNAAGIELGFIGGNGYILFNKWSYFEKYRHIEKFEQELPGCHNNNLGKFKIEQTNPNKSVGTPGTGESIHSVEGDGFHLEYLDSLAGPEHFWVEFRDNRNLFRQTFLVHRPYPYDSFPCMRPGDADRNQVVNHYDALYLGLAIGKEGPKRNDPVIDWVPQFTPAWQNNTAYRKVNFKNMDSNGDGTISLADTLALVQNWTFVVDAGLQTPNDKPMEPENASVRAKLSNGGSAAAGETASLELLVGSPLVPTDAVHGLAFSISYDPAILETGSVRFQPNDSWLGGQADLLCLQHNFPEEGRLDVAVSRMDGNPAMYGYGYIGNLVFRLRPDASPSVTQLRVKEMIAIDGYEGIKAFRGMRSGFTVLPANSNQRNTLKSVEAGLQVVPNPAKNYLMVNSPDATIQRLELCDAQGKIVAKMDQPTPEETRFDFENLPSGAYFLRIFTEAGVIMRKIAVQN